MAPDIGPVAAVDEAPTRPDRRRVLAFVTDAETEAALREGLVEVTPEGIDLRRGDIRAAIALLKKTPTPETLIIDVGGEEQPLSALAALSDVVEPDVRVLVIGDRDDVNFYRHVTRGLGALEYLYKPLLRDMVARHFGPLLTNQAAPAEAVHGGRVVAITGVRGGTGTSTLAANLAWHFATEARRHTVLLDADMHRGCAALLLGASAGSGLRTALETPQRIDELFVERAAQPAAERLHVLAGEEKLVDQPAIVPGAAAKLIEALRRRYNFVVMDLPFTGQPVHRELFMLAHQRVLVMEPSLVAVRDALRLLAYPNGPLQPRRAVVVLNRHNRPGGLTRRQIEDALKMKVDVAIPDLPRQLGEAATLGEPAAAKHGGFRTGLLDLAREVAFVRLLDAAGEGAAALAARPRRHRLFRWRS
jgi:pilus assembly protein CpaE